MKGNEIDITNHFKDPLPSSKVSKVLIVKNIGHEGGQITFFVLTYCCGQGFSVGW